MNINIDEMLKVEQRLEDARALATEERVFDALQKHDAKLHKEFVHGAVDAVKKLYPDTYEAIFAEFVEQADAKRAARERRAEQQRARRATDRTHEVKHGGGVSARPAASANLSNPSGVKPSEAEV